MYFKLTEPRQSDFFLRWESVGGKWELGLTQMMFGVRVRFGGVGKGWLTLDYCAGDDRDFQKELLRTVMLALVPFNEEVTERVIADAFPRYEIKPINRDPHCWVELQKMAAEAMRQSA